MSTLGWIIIALIIGVVFLAVVKAIAIAVIVLVTGFALKVVLRHDYL